MVLYIRPSLAMGIHTGMHTLIRVYEGGNQRDKVVGMQLYIQCIYS